MPVDVAATYTGPVCPFGFAPLPAQRVRVRGGGPFTLFSRFFADGSGPLQVYTTGGGLWRAAVYRGAAVADGALIWDPTSGSWAGRITAICSPGSHVDYDIRWYPEVYMSGGMLRAAVDEVTPDGGLRRWQFPLVALDGSVGWTTAQTPQTWDPGFWAPGTWLRLGSSALPREGGQVLRFEW